MSDELVTLPRAHVEALEAEVARLKTEAEASRNRWAERWALYRERVRARERGEETEP